MVRTGLVVTALAVGLVGAAAAAAPAPPKLVGTIGPGYTTLVGTVGPGFTIKLTQNGAKVAALKAGKYLFVVTDLASIHNFVLEQETGGKLEKDLTTVPFMGTNVFAVTLAKGKYKFYCRPHESSMFGEFTVS